MIFLKALSTSGTSYFLGRRHFLIHLSSVLCPPLVTKLADTETPRLLATFPDVLADDDVDQTRASQANPINLPYICILQLRGKAHGIKPF